MDAGQAGDKACLREKKPCPSIPEPACTAFGWSPAASMVGSEDVWIRERASAPRRIAFGSLHCEGIRRLLSIRAIRRSPASATPKEAKGQIRISNI